MSDKDQCFCSGLKTSGFGEEFVNLFTFDYVYKLFLIIFVILLINGLNTT